MLEFLFVDSNGDYTDSYVDGTGEVRACEASAGVGDLVVTHESTVNGVDVIADNFETRDVIGIITEKKDATTCVIMTKGKISGLTGLTKARKVYLGADGSLTPTKQESGYIAIMGHAVDADALNFDPLNTKIMCAPVGFDTVEEAEANPQTLDTTPLADVGDTMTQTYNLG